MLQRLCTMLAVLSLTAAVAAPAQQFPVGTMTIHGTFTLPDSMTRKIPGGAMGPIAIDVRAASDGRRLAIDFSLASPGTGMMAMFAGAHLRGVYAVDTDTIHLALLMPQMPGTGAAGGYKIDFPKSVFPSFKGKLDSMMGPAMDSGLKLASKAEIATISLHRASTVAGVACEEWLMVTNSDTTTMCVTTMPPALIATRDRMIAMMPMGDQMKALSNNPKYFDGRQMITLRMASPRGFSMELVRASSVAPADSEFTLPANLMPAPFALPKTLGGGTQ